MKTLLAAATLIAGGLVCLEGTTLGHGGTYRGPGDTVPAGGGGSTGTGPVTPGPGGPGVPGPANPTGPGPVTPGTPTSGPGAPTGGSSPVTPSSFGGPDLTAWQFWWGFNKEPYLQLKSHVQTAAVQTDSEEDFLGRDEKKRAKNVLRPSEETIRGQVVPALLQALGSERSNHIVTGCMVALAKIGDPKDESGAGRSGLAQEFKRFLADSNQEIAETAAVALGILASDAPANVELLTALLEDQRETLRARHGVALTGNVSDRTRAFAAYGLGLIGNRARCESRPAIVGALTRSFDGDARKLASRDVAVACITSIGLVALPIEDAALARPLGAKSGYARPREVASRIDQLAWLMSTYEDGSLNHLVRAHVPQAVARLMAGLPSGAEALREGLAARFLADLGKASGAQDEIKQSCISALGDIADCDGDELDTRIRAALMDVKEESSNQVARNFALIALAHCAGRPGQGDAPLAGLAGKRSARAFLCQQLADGKGNTRAWAALALGVLERALADAKQPASTDAQLVLRAALKDSRSPSEVGAFAIALGILQDQGASRLLREKLQATSDYEAKGYVAVALGLVGDQSAKELIAELVARSKYQPELLKQAAIGLGLLGDKSVVDALVQMLDSAQGLSAQAAVSSALGFIGDAHSLPPLIRMLQDQQKTPEARSFAAVALGIVADKEDLPWNTKIALGINYTANTATLTSPSDGTGILDIL